MNTMTEAPLPCAHSQLVWSEVLMLTTCSEPLSGTLEKTETVLDVVDPGPEIVKAAVLGENVSV